MATLTFNTTDTEMQVLNNLAKTKGMSKTAIIKQALKLYQLIDKKIEDGCTIRIQNGQISKKTGELIDLVL